MQYDDTNFNYLKNGALFQQANWDSLKMRDARLGRHIFGR